MVLDQVLCESRLLENAHTGPFFFQVVLDEAISVFGESKVLELPSDSVIDMRNNVQRVLMKVKEMELAEMT